MAFLAPVRSLTFSPDGSLLAVTFDNGRGERMAHTIQQAKKIMDKEGMMREIRGHRYYEKPSEKKRRKAARARSRAFLRS